MQQLADFEIGALARLLERHKNRFARQQLARLVERPDIVQPDRHIAVLFQQPELLGEHSRGDILRPRLYGIVHAVIGKRHERLRIALHLDLRFRVAVLVIQCAQRRPKRDHETEQPDENQPGPHVAVFGDRDGTLPIRVRASAIHLRRNRFCRLRRTRLPANALFGRIHPRVPHFLSRKVGSAQ